jgi:hypothetical protein
VALPPRPHRHAGRHHRRLSDFRGRESVTAEAAFRFYTSHCRRQGFAHRGHPTAEAPTQGLEIAPPDSLAEQLLGVWRVRSYEDRGTPEDAWAQPYGPEVDGLVIYDRSGWLSVHASGAVDSTATSVASPSLRFANKMGPLRESCIIMFSRVRCRSF